MSVKSSLVPSCLANQRMGRIHSKFTKGLNLQFGDSLVYIGGSGTALSAFGLNIAGEKLQKLLACVKPGDLVVNKGNALFLYSMDGTFTINYKDMAEADLKLPPITCRVSDIPAGGLYNYLAGLAWENILGIELDETTVAHVNLLINASKTDQDINRVAIRFFAGRGKGLTPGGDDLLLGFTLALMLFGSFDAWRQALAEEVAGGRTTAISEAYFRALLQGYASESVIRLAKLVDEQRPEIIETTIREVQAYGHTSGNDTLFGFFLGLTFLSKQQEGNKRADIPAEKDMRRSIG